ncbi:fluoride efflux transporter FluC [Sphingomonas sp. 179-I 2A4 NHS]|uniref:fluoride efflux transporter FluC n=1 Tax=unclassified Sphingomonas TaxID=196159 RepID=UPI0038794C70
MLLSDVALVALGGGVGSLLRWGVGKLVPGSGGIPWSTIIINITGAFAIGYLSVLFSVEWHDRYGSFLKSAILTGVLGGYTTFSTMELDTVKMFRAGNAVKAAFYIIGQLALGVAMAGLGAELARGGA